MHVYIVSLHCIQRVRGRDGTPTQPFWRPTELRLHFHIFLRPKRQSLDVTWESHGIGVIYCDCQNPNCLSPLSLGAFSTLRGPFIIKGPFAKKSSCFRFYPCISVITLHVWVDMMVTVAAAIGSLVILLLRDGQIGNASGFATAPLYSTEPQ